ncbi:MAG: VOC family protein [Nitrososphaerota archaeon]|nr:VOC family protein [Nitrososphaerota archaeon]
MKEDRDGGPAFIYTGIRVKDMDESIAFYTRVLNMTIAEKRERTEPTKGEVVTLKSKLTNQLLELNWYASDSPYCSEFRNGEELDHLAFEVDDIDQWVSELHTRGVKIEIRPGEIGGWMGWKETFIKDPNGIWIEFLQRKK